MTSATLCPELTPQVYLTTINGVHIYESRTKYLVSRRWIPDLLHKWVITDKQKEIMQRVYHAYLNNRRQR